MIFITGDMHGDKTRFKKVKKSGIKKGDTLLVCGDFGFLWNNTSAEKRVLKWIGKRRYNVAFVDGYNDKAELLEAYPISEWNEGGARVISGKLVALLRGEVYHIEEKTVFAFGGGDSNDRENDSSNDYLKLPTTEQIANAYENLAKVNNIVDIIITHDTSSKIKQFNDMETNELTHLHTFLQDISMSVKFKKWYCGKYHYNKIIPPCYHMLFTDVVKYSD